MILDKLFEKKDILAYIDLRMRVLANEKKKAAKAPNVSRREIATRQIQGRILELRYLKNSIQRLKDKSKEEWERCAKEKLL
jgi:hypothetical protein